jgi:hypothetical protein
MRLPIGFVALAAVLIALAPPGLAQPRRTVGARLPTGRPMDLPPETTPQPPSSPGGAQTTAGTSQDAQGRPTNNSMTQKQMPAPGLVGMVGEDGRPTRQLTPGGVYALVGSTFGDAKGQVRLLSPRWPGGVEYLTVLSWTDGDVQVAMPSDISGQPDFPLPGNPRDTLTLQLTTAAGEIYTLSPAPNFYAARQHLVGIPALVAEIIDLSGVDQTWPLTIGHYTPAKGVYRYKSGSDIGCPNPGRDAIRLTLHNNWAIKGYLVEDGTSPFGSATEDAHHGDGSTNYSGPHMSGSAAVTRSVPGTQTHIVDFTVDWGVYRSHHSGPMMDDSKRDECTAQYFLLIGLDGPSGTVPYRDWSTDAISP